MLVLVLMFAGKKDDYSFFCSTVVSRLSFHSSSQCQFFVVLGGIIFLRQLVHSTLQLRRGTSGKTEFVKADWDKLLEQWYSGDRGATSFVADTLLQVDCIHGTVNPWCPRPVFVFSVFVAW